MHTRELKVLVSTHDLSEQEADELLSKIADLIYSYDKNALVNAWNKNALEKSSKNGF